MCLSHSTGGVLWTSATFQTLKITYCTEYNFLNIDYIEYLVNLCSFAAWLDQCDLKIIFECSMQSQVLYVVPITSILGRVALVPIGDTGTIQFTMYKESKDFHVTQRWALATAVTTSTVLT